MISFEHLGARHLRRERERLRDLRENVADALARNPPDELSSKLARHQLQSGPALGFREVRRAVVEEDCEGRMRLAKKTEEGASLLQVLRQFVYVDDRYD